jgi:hypothetical protein
MSQSGVTDGEAGTAGAGATSAGTAGTGATGAGRGGSGGGGGAATCAGPVHTTDYRIEGADAARDIEAFGCVEETTGSLTISATNLGELRGLERLRSIGRDLIIGGANASSGNTELVSLAGLTGLESIGGRLEVANNPRLDSLGGLEGLRSVGGDVRINSQPASLAGLGGPLTVAGDFLLTSVPLENFTAVEAGVSIQGWLYVHSSPNLTTLDGLDRWAFSGLVLDGNSKLETLSGWSPAPLWNGDLTLRANAMLADLSALSSLETLGSLTADGAHAFTDFRALSNLRILGRLELGGGTMQNARGFSSLTRIELLTLSFSAIEDFRGLEAVESLGQLYLRSNERLVSFEGLEGLQRIDGRLVIIANGFAQSDADAFAARFGKTCECPEEIMSCVCSGVCECR